MFIIKCLELKLISISRESCLFMKNEIFMFFYVNDIVFVFKTDKKYETSQLIDHLKKMFEFKDLKHLQYFLRMRIIQDRQTEIVHLMQDVYMKKLIKNYEIIFLINQKILTSILY